MDLTEITLDESKEDGVDIPIDETTTLTISRVGSKKYTKALQRAVKPHAAILKNARAGDNRELIDRIQVDVLAEAVLVGWKGLRIAGKEVAYSKDKAREILGNPRYKVFRDLVEDLSEDATNFFEEAVKEATGNS